MEELGNRIMEFLERQPGVTFVRDASSREYGDGIRCRFGGRNWFIALTAGGSDYAASDPREEVQKEYS